MIDQFILIQDVSKYDRPEPLFEICQMYADGKTEIKASVRPQLDGEGFSVEIKARRDGHQFESSYQACIALPEINDSNKAEIFKLVKSAIKTSNLGLDVLIGLQIEEELVTNSRKLGDHRESVYGQW